MELGKVYKENGEISYEKLFYHHYRRMPNYFYFFDVDGCEMARFITETFADNIKEEQEERCFLLDKETTQLTEKTIIFHTHELMKANGYYFSYYYEGKRLLSDEYLKQLAIKYSNECHLMEE
jgi:hypothetical protein